jgi:hypothetical protein
MMDTENEFIKIESNHLPTEAETGKWEHTGALPFYDDFIYDIAGCYEVNDMLLITTARKFPYSTFVNKDHPKRSDTYLSLSNELGPSTGVRGVTDSCFISTTFPTKENITLLIENNKKISKEERALLSKLKDDDNPILLLFGCKIEIPSPIQP